ncbi:MAG: rane protein, partial [Gammaproteobacteria bacterium]|nr:rane protein [Gammaproteobacteria bacterium]
MTLFSLDVKKSHVSAGFHGCGFSFFIMLFLSGCISISPLPNTGSSWTVHQQQISRLKTWQASGVLGIKTPKESSTLYVQWQEKPDTMQLRLLGSLGTPSARLQGKQNEFVLTTSDGKIYRASQPEALAEQIVGSPLPISGLHYWIVGIPAPGTHEQTL